MLTNNFIFINILSWTNIIPFRYALVFLLTLYIFILSQDFNTIKRRLEFNVIYDRINTVVHTEQIYQVHNFLILGIYFGNFYYEPNNMFWGLTSLKLTIINLLAIFFILAIINLSHNDLQQISGVRSKIIKYSYFLTLALIFCNHLFLLFILLEIYTVLFFLYLIGFRYDMQETLYFLQHDLTTYVFTSILSTVFFITGLYFIIKDFGISALYLNELKILYESSLLYEKDTLNIRGMLFIFIALFIKLGLAPFQGWTVRFFKRTCYQSLVFILLISKLILIFGAFFTLLPVIINITFLLKFIGIFGFISYVIGSFLLYLRHSESDKFLAYINLTSSGFFFFIFFIDNPQNYNFAFIYFTTFMVLINFTLLTFFACIANWVYDYIDEVDDFEESYAVNRSFFLSQSIFFTMFDQVRSESFMVLMQNNLLKLILHGVLASLPPTITFFTKIYYDFSFFNKISDISSPYGLILIFSMLTYIITVYGFLAVWKEHYLRHNKVLTYILVKQSIRVFAMGYEYIHFRNFYRKFGFILFFFVGFLFSDFQIL